MIPFVTAVRFGCSFSQLGPGAGTRRGPRASAHYGHPLGADQHHLSRDRSWDHHIRTHPPRTAPPDRLRRRLRDLSRAHAVRLTHSRRSAIRPPPRSRRRARPKRRPGGHVRGGLAGLDARKAHIAQRWAGARPTNRPTTIRADPQDPSQSVMTSSRALNLGSAMGHPAQGYPRLSAALL